MSEFLRRVHYLLNRRRLDRELADDMNFHREMASRAGNGNFGDPLRLREDAREAWGWMWLDRLGQDLRYATRTLRRSPGFTLAAVMMLAIGIGVNVAAFSFFNLMFLRPLPVRDPDSLVRLKRRSTQAYAANLPYPEMAFVREFSTTLSAVLGVYGERLTLEGDPNPVSAQFVTANFFSELGGPPKLGQLPRPGSDPVVVLSEAYWQRRFGGDPLVAGKTIHLNGKIATVAGVVSREFSGMGLEPPDLWVPIGSQPYFVGGSKLFTDYSVDAPGVTTFGRLRSGYSAKAAEDELRALLPRLRAQHREIWEGERLLMVPGGYASNNGGSHHGTGSEGSAEGLPVIALAGTLCLLILAIACGNLGSLLLARGVAREREISIRTAIGVGKRRLVRQLLTESLVLALAGSAAGLIFGRIALRGLMVLGNTSTWLNPLPDWRVIAFSASAGLLSTLLFGLTPALQLANRSHGRTAVRQILVGCQVAASCVLLIVAGLLVRALNQAISTSPGFAYEQTLSINPGLASHGFSPAAARAYLDSLESRLRSIPGVASVSASTSPPLGNKNVVAGLDIDARHVDNIHMYGVDPQFFQSLEIPLLLGRNFANGDAHAVVVSQSFARRAWPGQNPLGRQLPVGDGGSTVIGVAASARLVALQDSDAVEAYFPASAADLPSMVVIARTAGPPEGLIPFMASIAKGIDPQISPDIQLLKTSFQRKLAGTERAALAAALLGLVALSLACLGIAGLVGYSVSQRMREIGLRMALGAKPRNVLAIVLRQFSAPVLSGMAGGCAAGAALSQILRQSLYGISNLDPLTYLAAGLIFGTTASVAALVPARRALRVDPMLALRHD